LGRAPVEAHVLTRKREAWAWRQEALTPRFHVNDRDVRRSFHKVRTGVRCGVSWRLPVDIGEFMA